MGFSCQMLHEVELGLTPKCILHGQCYQSSPVQHLWAPAMPFLSLPHTLAQLTIIWVATPRENNVPAAQKPVRGDSRACLAGSEGSSEPQ